MKKLFFITFTVLAGIVLALGDISWVCAQGTDEFTLEEITVTAQKREENQQKVPIAMEVISGDEIKELGQNDVQQILSSLSNVIINKATDGLKVSIRGISNDFGAPQEEINLSTPTVAVNMDGVYSNRINLSTNLFDVERVEALYGPQSTLYASASPGGIVNIVTANPKTDEYDMSGTIEYGNYNHLRMEGMVNAPLSDKIALRAAYSQSYHNGYITNGTDDQDSESARLKALYQPTDNLSIVLTGEIAIEGGHGFSPVEGFVDQDDVDNPWTVSSELRAGTTVGSSRSEPRKKIYARIDWDFGNAGTLSIVPTYSKSKRDTTGTGSGAGGMYPGSVDLTVRKNHSEEKGVEMRMASSADFFFKWIGGFNWYHSKEQTESVKTSTLDGEVVSGQTEDMHNLQKIVALYGNITYPINDRFRATGGIRKSWDTNSTHGYYTNLGQPTWTSNPEIEYDKFNYKLGMEYDISEQSMFYMDWSNSYRINGGQYTTSDGGLFPPEELDAYTIGAKSRFFGNKLQVNASAYYYDYRNYLVYNPIHTIYDANGNGVRDPDETRGQEDATKGAVGDARVYGVDIQTSTILTDKDKLDLSISYLRKYLKSLYFDYSPITNSMGLQDYDYSDKDMTNSPRWTISVDYSHNFQLPNGGILTGRIDARYQSSYLTAWLESYLQFNDDYTAVEVVDMGDMIIQESHYIANLSSTYSHPDGKWTLTGYVKNVMNYAEKLSCANSELVIGSPRTYGAILSVRY